MIQEEEKHQEGGKVQEVTDTLIMIQEEESLPEGWMVLETLHTTQMLVNLV